MQPHTRTRAADILRECLFDLGVTVVYATFAGLLIVAIVTSDNGPISIWSALVYAALLPGAVAALIAIEASVRIFADGHAARPAVDRSLGQRPGRSAQA